jgi:hypothetical protein
MAFVGETPAVTVVDSATEPLTGYSITLGATATLATYLAALTPAAAVPLNMRRLTLVPRSGCTGNYQVGGAAASTTPQIPSGGFSRSCQAANAASMQLQGSGTLDIHFDG